VRSELYALLKIGVFGNKLMQYAVSASIILLLAVVYVPFLQDVFNTSSLALQHWSYLLPLILLPSIAAEITKSYLRAQHRREQATQTVHQTQ
jgi:Ca2+-transporting ATPase